MLRSTFLILRQLTKTYCPHFSRFRSQTVPAFKFRDQLESLWASVYLRCLLEKVELLGKPNNVATYRGWRRNRRENKWKTIFKEVLSNNVESQNVKEFVKCFEDPQNKTEEGFWRIINDVFSIFDYQIHFFCLGNEFKSAATDTELDRLFGNYTNNDVTLPMLREMARCFEEMQNDLLQTATKSAPKKLNMAGTTVEYRDGAPADMKEVIVAGKLRCLLESLLSVGKPRNYGYGTEEERKNQWMALNKIRQWQSIDDAHAAGQSHPLVEKFLECIYKHSYNTKTLDSARKSFNDALNKRIHESCHDFRIEAKDRYANISTQDDIQNVVTCLLKNAKEIIEEYETKKNRP